MPRLKSIKFSSSSKSGEVFWFVSEVSVNNSGVFSLTIPDELEDVARAVIETVDRSTYSVVLVRPRMKLLVSGHDLERCESFVKVVCQDFMSCDISEEKVILYGTDVQIAYVKDEQGNIYPNGYIAGRSKYDRECRWHGTLNAADRDRFYRVGLAAVVRNKITYARRSGSKVEFKRVEGEHGSYLEKLDSFVGLSINPASMKEMPYSEEAARFFYEMMLGLCRLADRLTVFLNDDLLLRKAIEQRASLCFPPQHNSQ